MTARKLRISDELLLPPDVVTATQIVYGGKGMGKTNYGSVLAEECAAAGLRFSVIDPMGVWWGLRHSADGKGPGIEVLLLGGIHGDIPIEPTGGAVVADLVVDEDANVVIDTSRRPDGTMWSIGERVRFVRDYCKRLYQRQGEKRRPLLQLIDEAARFIPQLVRKEEGDVAACMGAIAVLVEEGRNVGVGVCLITQRSARLNKDVAELADCMIAFRTLGPNSRRAVLDWLGEHIEKNRIKDFDEKVRALPRGAALVVSPGWLEYEGIVPMRMRHTFDSSATPKSGQERRASGPGAKPDLGKYRERMAATIEQAKANDPRQLKKKIAELERQMATRPAAAPARAEVKTERVEVPILSNGDATALRDAVRGLQEVFRGCSQLAERLVEAGGQVAKLGHSIDVAIARATGPDSPARRPLQTSAAPRPAAPVGRVHTSGLTVPPRPARLSRPAPPAAELPDGIGNLEHKILDQLAELEALGLTPTDKQQLGLFAGYTNIRSGGFSEPMGRLVRAGLIAYPTPGSVILTDAGRAVARPGDAPATTETLQERILQKLDGPRAKLLRELLGLYPSPITKAELGERCGYTNIRSGGFSEPLGSLRTLGLVEYPTLGEVRAADALFLEEARR